MFHFRSRLEGRISTCCLLGTLLLSCLASGSQALTLSELYPYGSQDEVLNKEATDVSSPEIALTVPIVLFQDTFGSVYVNDNGLLSFMTEVSGMTVLMELSSNNIFLLRFPPTTTASFRFSTR